VHRKEDLMNLLAAARSRAGVVLLAVGCLAVGGIAGPPAVQAAQDKITAVLVKNTDAEPVPVKGTVTVANQPGVPPAPVPVQRSFKVSESGALVGFAETVYTVPADKVLTVEYAQISVLNNVDIIDASLRVGCNVAQEGSVGQASYELPAVQAGDLLKVFGGPMKLHVPGGGCLRFVGTAQSPPSDGPGVADVWGSITGYLSDARSR
jgi:hypothetical protein